MGGDVAEAVLGGDWYVLCRGRTVLLGKVLKVADDLVYAEGIPNPLILAECCCCC